MKYRLLDCSTAYARGAMKTFGHHNLRNHQTVLLTCYSHQQSSFCTQVMDKHRIGTELGLTNKNNLIQIEHGP